MGRKIVLLSDGTGNSAAKVWRTNVWRVFESLDLSGSDQIAFYDDGVGTSSFKPVAVLGGAFGFGLKRNIIDLYKFACRNYRDADDEIYAFGFSRGAFTIRVLIGLILEQGLVKADTEAELHAKAKRGLPGVSAPTRSTPIGRASCVPKGSSARSATCSCAPRYRRRRQSQGRQDPLPRRCGTRSPPTACRSTR